MFVEQRKLLFFSFTRYNKVDDANILILKQCCMWVLLMISQLLVSPSKSVLCCHKWHYTILTVFVTKSKCFYICHKILQQLSLATMTYFQNKTFHLQKAEVVEEAQHISSAVHIITVWPPAPSLHPTASSHGRSLLQAQLPPACHKEMLNS